MIVKICGITNLADALAAVDFGASALGFNFYPQSPRYIAPEEAARLIEALPAGPWKVGVFVNEPPESVLRIAALAHLDVVQLHGEADFPAGPFRVWKALPVDANFHPGRLDAYTAEAILLDAPSGELYGGTGKTFDWARAAASSRKIVIAGGLDADNVAAAIQQARPWGVDACSRLESSPGRKDHARMARFLKAALGVGI
jgi:phosphoribosylanthranilate isomerase